MNILYNDYDIITINHNIKNLELLKWNIHHDYITSINNEFIQLKKGIYDIQLSLTNDKCIINDKKIEDEVNEEISKYQDLVSKLNFIISKIPTITQTYNNIYSNNYDLYNLNDESDNINFMSFLEHDNYNSDNIKFISSSDDDTNDLYNLLDKYEDNSNFINQKTNNNDIKKAIINDINFISEKCDKIIVTSINDIEKLNVKLIIDQGDIQKDLLKLYETNGYEYIEFNLIINKDILHEIAPIIEFVRPRMNDETIYNLLMSDYICDWKDNSIFKFIHYIQYFIMNYGKICESDNNNIMNNTSYTKIEHIMHKIYQFVITEFPPHLKKLNIIDKKFKKYYKKVIKELGYYNEYPIYKNNNYNLINEFITNCYEKLYQELNNNINDNTLIKHSLNFITSNIDYEHEDEKTCEILLKLHYLNKN